MSKKNRRQKRKGFQLKHAAVIVGGLLILAAAILMFRGNINGGGGDIVGGTPAVVADQNVIDYGDLKDGTVKTFAIKVTNTGTGTLRFSGEPYIEVVQGCCPPTLTAGSMSLNPGQSTTITSSQFMMHPGMDGKHDFAIHIKTNDPTQPDLVVHVFSNWSE